MVIASRNSSRSSALSMASAVAPIISTSYCSSTPIFFKRQGAIERRLAAHGRQQGEAAGDGVALLGDDLGDDLGRDRLDIGAVRHVGIGHDRRRIGVDQDDPVALGAQRLDGLGAGIVELAGLADDDRPGADDEDRRDVCPLRHASPRGLGAQKKAASVGSRPLGIMRRGWPARCLDEICGGGKGGADGPGGGDARLPPRPRERLAG